MYRGYCANSGRNKWQIKKRKGLWLKWTDIDMFDPSIDTSCARGKKSDNAMFPVRLLAPAACDTSLRSRFPGNVRENTYLDATAARMGARDRSTLWWSVAYVVCSLVPKRTARVKEKSIGNIVALAMIKATWSSFPIRSSIWCRFFGNKGWESSITPTEEFAIIFSQLLAESVLKTTRLSNTAKTIVHNIKQTFNCWQRSLERL